MNGVYDDPSLDLPPEKPLHLAASAGEDIEGLRSAHYGGTGYVGAGLMYNTLDRSAAGLHCLTLQEAYVRKVVDTVNDLDNVLYETCNEAGAYSLEWQYHMIRLVKEYESGKPKQHPVGMTFRLCAGIRRPTRNASFLRQAAFASLKG